MERVGARIRMLAAALMLAAPATACAAPDLAGSNQIDGTRAVMLVHLPQTATVSLETGPSVANPDVAFSNWAPGLTGVELYQWPLPPAPNASSPVPTPFGLVLLKHSDWCTSCAQPANPSTAYAPGHTDTQFDATTLSGTGTLPAGDYVLEVVGGPVHLRLKLHDADGAPLSGTAILSPAQPATQDVRPLPAGLLSAATGFASFGADGRMPAPGRLIDDAVFSFGAPEANVTDQCMLDGGASTPLAYGPGQCSDPNAAVDSPIVGAAAGTGLLLHRWTDFGNGTLRPGTYGLGGNATGPVTSIAAYGAWLPYVGPSGG